MTTEAFTVAQFESALPRHSKTSAPLWQPLGLKNGEYTYLIVIPDYVARIEVRSSIGADGVARAAGQDSIRAWLTTETGEPLGSKTQKYVTRVPGWDRRLLEMLRDLARFAKQVKACPVCKKPMGIFKVKKDGPNKGRLYQGCDRECKQFHWIEM